MTTINANMTDAQTFVPLEAADAAALDPGFYQLDSEYVEVLAPHATQTIVARNVDYPFDGCTVLRGVAGSTAASHTSGATLTRYYPDEPSGTADALTIDSLTPLFFSSDAAAPPSEFATFLYEDTTAVTGGLYAWDGAQYVEIAPLP